METHNTKEITNPLIEVFKRLQEKIGDNSSDTFIFRGLKLDVKVLNSAAERRIKKTTREYTYTDFINYHATLILEARQKYPDKYISFSDLEVLADIQHNGGATCLIDLSYNFLTALWFASQKIEKKDGKEKKSKSYVYAINLTKMIDNFVVSMIKPENAKSSITELLKLSRNQANYQDESRSNEKFWLWKPHNQNSRIRRQDSVFLFGLSNFKIKESPIKNGVLKIEIRAEEKQEIRKLLQTYFSIDASSIFPDVNGYAFDANNSERPLFDSNLIIGDENCLNRGIQNMLFGNYLLAIECFKQVFNCIKNDSSVSKSDKCHKCKENVISNIDKRIYANFFCAESYRLIIKQGSNRIGDVECADFFYKWTIRLIDDNQDKISDYSKKLKSYSYYEDVLLLFIHEKYLFAFELCEKIIKEFINKDMNKIKQFCLTQIELCIFMKDDTKFQKCCTDYQNIDDGEYYQLLYNFYSIIGDIILNSKDNRKDVLNSIIDKKINSPSIVGDVWEWNFKPLKEKLKNNIELGSIVSKMTICKDLILNNTLYNRNIAD